MNFICQMTGFLTKSMGPAPVELSRTVLQGLHLQYIIFLRINLHSLYFNLYTNASWAD